MWPANAPVGPAFLAILLLACPAAGESPFAPTHVRPATCLVRNFCPARPLLCEPGDVPADAGGENVCEALAEAADANDLPVDFFTRLIWQESRFDPKAVSRAGALGVAQFMPATAILRGLADPFDPAEAIVKSAQLLRDLRQEFGSLGLAAAAYNAGPGRVRDWLAGRRGLPGETRAYVRIVTGRSAEEWIGAPPPEGTEMPLPGHLPCGQIAGLVLDPGLAAAPARVRKPVPPWGVELVGSTSESGALAAYRLLQQKHSAILAGYEPRVVFHGVIRDMGWARVRVDAESRESANKLCASLRAAGAGCDVLRN
jgi:hypothetical protein